MEERRSRTQARIAQMRAAGRLQTTPVPKAPKERPKARKARPVSLAKRSKENDLIEWQADAEPYPLPPRAEVAPSRAFDPQRPYCPTCGLRSSHWPGCRNT